MDLAHFESYKSKLQQTLAQIDFAKIAELTKDLTDAWSSGRQVFFCGNGGSAGNAAHIANDFIYGVGKGSRPGMKCHALSANSSVITCLANDEGYEKIFSLQLKALANKGDILIALSGSGNSPNIVQALTTAKEMGIKTYALLGYGGGKSLQLADCPIHFPIHDMQISEDLQMVVMHMVAQSMMKECRHG